jgi:hypothetical protein
MTRSRSKRANLVGVHVEHIDIDPDYVKLRFTASNGVFSGSVDLYSDTSVLSAAAATLAGFPQRSFDQCAVEFGTFQPSFAGGGLRMIFKCIDSPGHTQLQIVMETECDDRAPSQSVSMLLPIEAAAIDTFVTELKEMEKNTDATATLNSF